MSAKRKEWVNALVCLFFVWFVSFIHYALYYKPLFSSCNMGLLLYDPFVHFIWYSTASPILNLKISYPLPPVQTNSSEAHLSSCSAIVLLSSIVFCSIVHRALNTSTKLLALTHLDLDIFSNSVHAFLQKFPSYLPWNDVYVRIWWPFVMISLMWIIFNFTLYFIKSLIHLWYILR